MATTDKYDRQLRLWGANGQRSLILSNILLINADAVGTETLKNLVLPGVGKFCILDDKIVDQRDLKSNFFLAKETLGRPRSQAVTELLSEMNPDVAGTAKMGLITDIIGADIGFISSFNLIITANLDEQQLLLLSDQCATSKVPLLIVRAYGLIGYVRLQLKNHNIIESRPDPEPQDLRIANPFKELQDYCDSFDLSALDSLEHSHVPYIVILYKAVSKWTEEHAGSLPRTYADKEAFKKSIAAMQAATFEGNFSEAIRDSYRAFTATRLPSEVQDLLETQKDVLLTPQTSDFMYLLRALQLFIQTSCGEIPLGGRVPDMTSTTRNFVELQRIYHDKAAADKAAFASIVDSLLVSSGRSVGSISEEVVDLFCKNVVNVRQLHTRTLAEERAVPAAETLEEAVCDPYDDPAQTPVLWYLALRGVDAFQSKYKRWPGSGPDSELEADVDRVWTEIVSVVASFGRDVPLITRQHAEEITRYGGCEMHVVAALIGGIGAQEAVKVLTQQYVPLDNTYVYNGVAGCGSTYAL